MAAVVATVKVSGSEADHHKVLGELAMKAIAHNINSQPDHRVNVLQTIPAGEYALKVRPSADGGAEVDFIA